MSGPLPRWLLPLTTPASWVYAAAVARRNARFDRAAAVRLDRPVVSIGNITSGGTGKTPMVAWLARRLAADGHAPVIAMRGYGARVGMMSDEQAELSDLLPGIPIVAAADRASALGEFLPRHPTIDCILLDDGFQHRRVHRDLDLVLIDATAGTMRDQLLPAGHLREPLANLRRADAVIVTRAARVDSALAEAIRKSHGRAPLAWSRHLWHDLLVVEHGRERREPATWLNGKRVVAMLGVGNPQAVLDQIQQTGAQIMHNIACRDHQRFSRRILKRLRPTGRKGEPLIVTGKDWVKLRALPTRLDWPGPIVVPQVQVEVFEGEAALLAMVRGTLSQRDSVKAAETG